MGIVSLWIQPWLLLRGSGRDPEDGRAVGHHLIDPRAPDRAGFVLIRILNVSQRSGIGTTKSTATILTNVSETVNRHTTS